MLEKIITNAKTNYKPFLQTTSFSELPGIYFIFYHSRSKFPVAPFNQFIKSATLLYIGKTLSSQISRELNTHFKSGKTGSSTVRRTLGAILKDYLKLKAIPRNKIDFTKGRSKYKFDEKSEEKLTLWMRENLGIYFYPFNGSGIEIDDLESTLIREVNPILNLSKNPNNPHLLLIKSLRKICLEEAKRNSLIATELKGSPPISKPLANQLIKKKSSNFSTVSEVHKYEDIWKNFIPHLAQFLNGEKQYNIIQLSAADFKKVGNRKSYSFNLELLNGQVQNNIGGSAVARDLKRVISRNQKLFGLLKGKHVKIRMDSNFQVFVSQI